MIDGVVVPYSLHDRNMVTGVLQRRLSEMGDEELDKMFDVARYIEQLRSELARLNGILARCEERRRAFDELQPDFFHPASTTTTTTSTTKK